MQSFSDAVSKGKAVTVHFVLLHLRQFVKLGGRSVDVCGDSCSNVTGAIPNVCREHSVGLMPTSQIWGFEGCETPTPVTFNPYPPTPQDVVMVTDRPWEGNASHYRTIIKDGDRYRMYFSGLQYVVRDGANTHAHERFLCYAESTDGVHWERPDLGLVEFDGATRNNIVADSQSVEGITIDPSRLVPFKDLNPDCPQDAQYKAVVMGFENTNQIDATTGKPQSKKRGLFALKSADGFHFKLMSDRPILTKGAFDSQNLAFFEPAAGVYREYHRGYRDGFRSILTGTSRDFLQWTASASVEFPQAPREHIYTNQVQPYYRAPHILVGFPLRYIDRGWIDATGKLPGPELRRARSNVHPRFGSAVTDGVFMSSRDGRHFKRWGEAFIRPGIGRPGSWIYGDNSVAWGMIETKSLLDGAPDELSLYVTDGYWTGKSLNVRRYAAGCFGRNDLSALPGTRSRWNILRLGCVAAPRVFYSERAAIQRVVFLVSMACLRFLSAGLSDSQMLNNAFLNSVPATTPLKPPFLLTTTPCFGTYTMSNTSPLVIASLKHCPN